MGQIQGIDLAFGWSIIQGKDNAECLMDLLVMAADAQREQSADKVD